MRYCTSCGSEISESDRFCAHCGKSVADNVGGLVVAPEHDHQQTEPIHTYYNVWTSEIACPSCGKKSDSIKSFTMFKNCLFLGCYIQWEMVTYTCCPDCMRKKIIDEGIFTSKIIKANFFWLFVILPLAIIQLYLCGRKGHSKGIM